MKSIFVYNGIWHFCLDVYKIGNFKQVINIFLFTIIEGQN